MEFQRSACRCLHRRDINEQWQGYVRFFGIPCFDDSDLVDFEWSLQVGAVSISRSL